MKSISFILSLFFTGVVLKVSAVDSQYSMFFSQKIFQAENTKGESLIKAKEHKESGSKSKNKRQVAGGSMAYNCSQVWTNEFSSGYVQVGSKCNSDTDFCLAFFHIERNYCEGDKLIRFYCDPKQLALYSKETIKCAKGCEFAELSGACIK